MVHIVLNFFLHLNLYWSSQQLFHAGTVRTKDGKTLSNGGRVLNSTVIASNLGEARDQALKILDNLNWENKYYRRDIGFRAIKKWELFQVNLKVKN